MILSEDDGLFLLKFYGDDIHPDSFSAKELGNLLIKIEDSVKAVVEENYPKSDPEKCNISLVGIKDESESVYLKASGEPDINNAFYDWGKALENNSYINLPQIAYGGIKYLHTLVKQKKCYLKVVYKKEEIGNLSYEDILTNPDDSLIAIDTLLIGELEKIGGGKPRIWIKDGSGKISSVKITKEQAAILKPRLYETISVKVRAKWDVNTDFLSRLTLTCINEYEPGYSAEAINKIKGITSGFWDELDDEGILTFLRG